MEAAACTMGVPAYALTIALSFMLCLPACAEIEGPLVHTKLGALRGQYVKVKGQEADVQAYLGVPFAKPPVGQLRLAPPLPAEGWEATRDATKQPSICIQSTAYFVALSEKLGLNTEVPNISEDCLYLNVYTPANAAPGTNLPVMVWIHGGGFSSGYAATYDGSGLAAYQNVVVVVIQYRLGLLGFLSGDDTLPGNLGLLDQLEALRWVQQNIRDFGGDPHLVTIFGESAGGISVSLLAISPLATGLFQHAIAESGTAAMELLIIGQPEVMLQMAANALGCNPSSEMIIRCLRNMDTDAFESLSQDPTLMFAVTVDGHFLTDQVKNVFQNREFPKIPFMTGVNNDEGGWLLPTLFFPQNWTEGLDREPTIAMLGIFWPEAKDKPVQEMLVEKYLGTSEDRKEIRRGVTNLIGDALFTIPTIVTANAHRDAGAPVYLYQYHHSPQFLRERRPSFVGADHGDEIFTVFAFCLTPTNLQIQSKCSEDDLKMSKLMMTYWGNFARTGSPNGPGLVAWPQYGPEENYLSIGMEQEVLQHLAKDRFTFMTQTLYEKIDAARKEKTEHPEL